MCTWWKNKVSVGTNRLNLCYHVRWCGEAGHLPVCQPLGEHFHPSTQHSQHSESAYSGKQKYTSFHAISTACNVPSSVSEHHWCILSYLPELLSLLSLELVYVVFVTWVLHVLICFETPCNLRLLSFLIWPNFLVEDFSESTALMGLMRIFSICKLVVICQNLVTTGQCLPTWLICVSLPSEGARV